MLKNFITNSGAISKFLVAIVGAVSVNLTTHSWTNYPSILADVFAVLVYLVPNVAKVVTPTAPTTQSQAVRQP